MGKTSITIDEAVRDRLRLVAGSAKNYSEALTMILDQIEMERFVQAMQRRIDDPATTWVDFKDLDEDESFWQ